MPCNHKRVWEMKRYAIDKDQWYCLLASEERVKSNTVAYQLLKEGWDPHPWGEGCIMFKRLKPCEECEK